MSNVASFLAIPKSPQTPQISS